MTTRTGDVTNDVQNPLDKVTVTVAEGRSGSYALYEDDGTTTVTGQGSTTSIRYDEPRHRGDEHSVSISAAVGSFSGQVSQRQWTAEFMNATRPTIVTVNGHRAAADTWSWNAATDTLTVTAPIASVRDDLVIAYRGSHGGPARGAS